MLQRISYILAFLSVLSINCLAQWITWERTYLYSSATAGECVMQTSDGNYIVGGERAAHGGFILKLNPFGDTIWLRQDFPVEGIISVLESNSGSYLAIGRTSDFVSQKLCLIKINVDGVLQWTQTYSEPGHDVYPYHINYTNDGNFIIAGDLRTNNPTTHSPYYIKIANNGDRIWSRFIVSQTGDRIFKHVIQLPDDDYLFAGSGSFKNNEQVYLVKTNPSGDTLWSKDYGGLYAEQGDAVFATTDNGFFVIGSLFRTNPTFGSLVFLKTDSLGQQQWIKTYGTSSSSYGLFFDPAAYNPYNSSYVITGPKSNVPNADSLRAFLLNVDTSGNTIWEKEFTMDTLDVWGRGIDICSDSGYIICGNAFRYNLINDADPPTHLYVLKTNKFGEYNPIGINSGFMEMPSEYKIFQNFPNPFNPTTQIKYEIPRASLICMKLYDMLGAEIKTLVYRNHPPGTYSVLFDGKNLSSGIYFILLTSNSGYRGYIKIILLK